MSDVLIIQAARFGDLVQTRRLILSLAQGNTVHLAVDESLVPLANVLYPHAQVYGLPLYAASSVDAVTRCRAVLRQFADCTFDAVYNCNYSGFTAALCRSFDPEIVHGYRPSAGGIVRSPWVRMVFRLSEQRSITPLNLVDFWGYFAPGFAPNPVLAPVRPLLVNAPAAPGGRGLGIVLAGRESRRSLPMPLLADIVQTAFKALDGPRVYLLGSKAEQAAARKLLRLLPVKVQGKVEDLSGKTNWADLCEAVRGLDALVTPDTGIMHLAAQYSVPVLAFFLSSAWCHETGPYGQGHHIWQAVRHCAPCLESGLCSDATACITPFNGPELLRSVLSVLQNRASEAQTLLQGIQLLRSDLDDVGVVYTRLAGEDDGRELRRAAARALLREFWRLPAIQANAGAVACEAAPSYIDLVNEARLRLFHDEDWMLPPGRYC